MARGLSFKTNQAVGALLLIEGIVFAINDNFREIWEMMLISTHSLWSKYLTLIQENIRPSIVKPEIDGYVKFEINGNFLRELRRKLFEGTDDDDAHEHVQRVLEIVDLFYFTGVTHDAVMLRVFPITLSEPALRWKNRLFAGLITT
ncbi:hypothetical protein Tco_0339106 [Tanacetum coccineum]